MLLETERLQIRYITEDDWQSVKAIEDNFNLSEYSKYDTPHKTDEASIRTRLSKWDKENKGTDHMFFAICLQNTVIGYIAFNKREDGYEIGYCFHSDYHGKGYAKESHLALINYLHRLGIKKFTAGTALKNLPSVNLLKALGFKQIGEEKVSFYQDQKGNDIVFDGGNYELIL